MGKTLQQSPNSLLSTNINQKLSATQTKESAEFIASTQSNRLAQIRLRLQEQNAAAFYIRNTSNIAWATAFDNVFDNEDAHALLITKDMAKLHTDSRYSNAMKQAAKQSSVTKLANIKIDDNQKSHPSWAANEINTNLQALNKPIAIESTITLAEYRKLEKAFATTLSKKQLQTNCYEELPTLNNDIKFLETENVIQELRAMKSETEIARMQKAQDITDKAFMHIIDFIRPRMTEREIKAELERFMIEQGASKVAFETIVASGVNAANPHAISTNKPIEVGECIVMDFGAKYAGYCSDMTRTVFIGHPNKRLKHAYKAIRKANEMVEAILKPGITGEKAQTLSEEILKSAGFGGKMGHSLGHGVGMDIHELPMLSHKNTNALQKGNVVTVEPGIYIPKEFGMRLEDFGVITNDAYRVFTKSTHEMVIL